MYGIFTSELLSAVAKWQIEGFVASHPTAVLYTVVIVAVLAAVLVKWRGAGGDADGKVIVSSPTMQNSALKRIAVVTGMSNIKSQDPNFSQVSFVDFASLLFVNYHQNLGLKTVKTVQPFFNFELSDNSNMVCSNVVIDSVSLYDIRTEKDMVYIVLEFVSNYVSEVRPASTVLSHREKSTERWLFCRGSRYTSPPQPEPLGSFSGFCNDWKVASISIVSTMRISKSVKTFFDELSEAPAHSNNASNIKDLETMFRNYHRGEFSGFDQFCKNTATPCALSLWRNFENCGWNKPLKCSLSSNVENLFKYRHDRLAEDGFVSMIKSVDITDIQVTDYKADNFFESLTVNIQMSCLDYVVDSSQKTVAGSRTDYRDVALRVKFAAPHRKVFDRKSEFIVTSLQKYPN